MSNEPITEIISKPRPPRKPKYKTPLFDLEIACGGVVIAGVSFDPVKLNAVLLAIEDATGKKFK